MYEKQMLLAIGYQKTGSTWLDAHLWPHPQLGFFPIKSRALRQLIVGTRALEFDLGVCREQIQQHLPEIPANKVAVLGMERLSGSPHAGGYDSKEVADRLAGLFPNAKVLIVIREQEQMILSTYNQSVKGGNSMTLREYLIDAQPGRYAIPRFDLGRFCYHHLINYYISRFGRANVLVLPYEMFHATPQLYIRHIVCFAGLSVDDKLINELPVVRHARASVSWLSVAMLRQLNALIRQPTQFTPHPLFPLQVSPQRIKRALSWVEQLLPAPWLTAHNQRARQKLLAHIKQITAGYYEESNATVMQQTGLDLRSYGYALPVVE